MNIRAWIYEDMNSSIVNPVLAVDSPRRVSTGEVLHHLAPTHRLFFMPELETKG